VLSRVLSSDILALRLAGLSMVGVGMAFVTFSSGGESFRLLRGLMRVTTSGNSSLLVLSSLPESELVTAYMPFFTIRLLELCEVVGTEERVETDEKDVAGTATPSRLN
jgi:hypothetical protein